MLLIENKTDEHDVINFSQIQFRLFIKGNPYHNLSRDFTFPTMWYVRPVKPQISLRIRHLEFLSLTEGCTGSHGSILVKIPQYWKSHVEAQKFVLIAFSDYWWSWQ